MKIGVLTLPLAYNYGGILQAYALQKVIKNMGYDVERINYPFIREEPHVKTIIKRCISKYLLRRYDGLIFYEHKFNKWLPLMMQNTSKFINENIVSSNEIRDFSEISPNTYDVIVVGSDQIWRPKMFQLNPALSFLSFAKDWSIKRIAYAASFGTSDWEFDEAQTKECADLVSLFSFIGVREIDGVKLCKEYLHVDSDFVLDPTLLLEAKDYIELIDKSNVPKSKGTLFDYTLDLSPEKKDLISFISKKRSLTPFSVNSKDGNISCPLDDRIAKPVESWLRGFYDSDLIVTDSFHACVFSIIFRKPFVVVANRARGMSRFTSLLGSLGLMNRMVENIVEYKSMPSDIDYEVVYKKLNQLKDKSWLKLKNALEKY